MQSLLALRERPTAIFAGSDSQAVGALDVARQHGLRVPRDLSVVGCNDIELAPYLGLTTMRLPMRELGRLGIQSLVSLLEDPSSPHRHIRLPSQLVVRRTTAAAGSDTFSNSNSNSDSDSDAEATPREAFGAAQRAAASAPPGVGS